MNTGVELIAAERQRQIDAEGYTPEHDVAHNNRELIYAAVCYAAPPELRGPMRASGTSEQFTTTPVLWPWGPSYWKPTPEDRVRELVKAGALIAAEIDRLQS